MDHGIGANQDTGPVQDAGPPVVAGGPPWRPWWVVGDRSRVRWNLGTAAGWTVLAAVSFSVSRSSWWTPVNWALLAAVYWTLGLIGLTVLHRRPDLARRPRRPSTPLATTLIVMTAVAAVGGVIAFEVLVPDQIGRGLIWFAVGVVACAVLGVIGHRLNDRAEASGRFAPVTNRPGRTA